MDCSAEEAEIRRALEGLSGIRSLGFSLGARTLRIDAEPGALEPALAAIRKAGFDPMPAEAAALAQGEAGSEEHDHSPEAGPRRMAAALAFAVTAEALSFVAPETQAWKIAGMAVAAVAIWLAGLDVYKKGIAALLRGKLNINALMSVAVTGAFVIGEWPEAAMVMALYAIAELIEAKAVDRARNSIKDLLAMAPETATVLGADGKWSPRAAAQVEVGATIRVAPGERVPLDAVVVKGESAVNQAPITGESIPVDKAAGMPLFAGSVNETGELEARVTAGAANTTLARIIEAVERAQGSRAPTQRFVDRFAAIYTPAIFAIAVATAVLLPWFAGATWLEALYKALVLLVIACPCALVISTPVTLVSGLAAAARRGILIKGGVHLEQARRLRVIALDKTGTLTAGQPRLVAQQSTSGAGTAAPDLPEVALQAVARSLAARSDHPVSQALAAGLDAPLRPVAGFAAEPGRGVRGEVGGRAYVLGNHRWMEERGQCSPALEALLRAQEAQGRSVTLLADEQRVLALFAVADTLKPDSAAAIAQLKALGLRTVMLSGDAELPARAVATELGLDEVRAQLLPQHKLEAIRELGARGPVAMVGDGINDGPALSAAALGVGMGARGSDIALEAADVLIMNDDLRKLPELIRLSRRTQALLWQNIALALGIKAAFLGLALFDSASMWMAVFADMGASLLVVFNGLRLLRGVRVRR